MNSPPSILFIPEFFATDLLYAAFGERCRAMAEEFGASGFDVTVLVLRRSNVDDPLVSSAAFTVARRTKWMTKFFIANFPINMLQRVHAFIDILRCAREKRPSAIVVSAHDAMFYLAALVVGSLLDVPVVTDAHDSRLVLESGKSRRPRRIVKIRLERIAMRWADRIWLPTEGLADLLSRGYGIPRDRFLVVGNGMRMKRFLNVARAGRESRELLHLGSPREYYDSAILVEAFERVRSVFPDASLVFLGIRNDEYTTSIRKLAQANGLSESIRFLPSVPLEDVPASMAHAAVGIHTYALHPAYATTVGLKVLEYMAAGLPIVHRGPRGGETWRLVEENGVGLCVQTGEELAEALLQLLSSPELCERLASRALALAPKYDWTETIRPAVNDLRGLIS